MKAISRKTIWVSTNAWRGYEQPINAVAGANDTGTLSDSPCNSNTRRSEIDAFLKKLRKEKIRFRTIWARTSNIFCSAQMVLVDPENRVRAYKIAKAHEQETSLFYAINVPKQEG